MSAKEIFIASAYGLGFVFGTKGEVKAQLIDENDCVSFDQAANIFYNPAVWNEDSFNGNGGFESEFEQKSKPGERGYVHEDDVNRGYSLWNAKEGRWYTDEEAREMGAGQIIVIDGDADIDGYMRTTKHSTIKLTDGTVIEPVVSCYYPKK